MIAIDADDMRKLRTHLRDAASDMGSTVPAMPGSQAFGPAVLVNAAASFERSMRARAESLSNTWTTLETGVEETLDDMSQVEDRIVSALAKITGALE